MNKHPTQIQIAIAAASFNKTIVNPMIAEAVRVAQDAGALVTQQVEVAGCYELPLVADALLMQEGCDLVIVLGYIEKGETLHGEVMGHVVQMALIDLQIKTGKPIGIGIIGPGATLAQAQKRKIPAARAAVEAALSNLAILKSIDTSKSDKPKALPANRLQRH